MYDELPASSPSIQTQTGSRENGGDDGTRTRDLCRDRAAF